MWLCGPLHDSHKNKAATGQIFIAIRNFKYVTECMLLLSLLLCIFKDICDHYSQILCTLINRIYPKNTTKLAREA
jgi:hypothetical protein